MNKMYYDINSLVVEIFNDVLYIEEKVLKNGHFNNVTLNELHTLEAIGLKSKKSMTEVARKLNITVGTLTTSINNLVRKGYVERTKDEVDKRMVIIGLTRSGRILFRVHQKFHLMLIKDILSHLDENSQKNLLSSLISLDNNIKANFYKNK